MRFKWMLGLCLCSGLAQAQWTGVALSLGDAEADWHFSDATREAQISSISFQIEEKSSTELRVGAHLGHLNLRVPGSTVAESRRFDAQFIGIYLRLPMRISESFSLHGELAYRYHSGDDNDETDPADIEWSEVELQLGASLRVAGFRIMPFVGYTDLDGDISDDSGTDLFDLEDPVSRGFRFDYFIDQGAFVRLEFQAGDRSGHYLSFVRRY